MALHPDTPYSPVPSVEPSSGASPNDYIRSDATPADFGGQIGQAIQGLGQTGERVAGEASDIATQRQGMINESLAQNAESQGIQQYSDIGAQYKSLEGLDAVAAHDQTIKDLMSVRQTMAASLPNVGSQRAFNQLMLRHEAYAVSDAGTYYASQVKSAAVKSASALTANSINASSNPDVAADDARFNYNLQSATYGLNQQMQHQGYGSAMSFDSNGNATFQDTPEGQNAKAVYTEKHDELVGMAWKNRIQALTNDPTSGNVSNAFSVFNAHKSDIPPQAQAEISSFLTPKLRAVNADNAAGAALRDADQGYRDSVSPVAPSSVPTLDQPTKDRALQVRDGLIQRGMDSQTATAYAANAVQESRAQWNTQPGDMGASHGLFMWRDNRLQAFQAANNGQMPEQTSLNAQLDFLMKERAGAEADASGRVDAAQGLANKAAAVSSEYLRPKDVVAERNRRAGIALQLDGGQNYSTGGQGGPNQIASAGDTFETPDTATASGQTDTLTQNPATPRSSPPPPAMTKADYYRLHESDIVESARQNAMQAHPDDPAAADLAASRSQQQVNAVIRQQEVAYHADSDMIWQAANGDLSKGTAPLTVDQLRATSPQVAAAWDRMQSQQPQVAHEVATRLLTENARSNGADARTYGAGFISVFDRIHSDGPDKITDPSQLYNMVGQPGGLTMSGLEKARQEIAGKNTPDGEAESKMREQMFRNAHGQLTGKNDGLGLIDPKGEEIYLKFMAAAYPAIDAAKSAGKSPSQLYNPDSPDYIGKLANGMKRTPAQFQSDMMSSNLASPAQAAGASQAYSRADLQAEMARRGLLKPTAAPQPSSPQAPTNE